MIRRFSLAAFLAGLLLGGAPVGAQEVEDGVLGAAEVDTSAYPELELTVSLPAGFASDEQASDASGEPTVPVFVVTEEGAALPVEGEALSSSALDVVLAIDTSGSMSGGALDAARSAALAFATELPASARIGIVGFGPTPVTALELTADREALAVALIGLQAQGETALYDAVDLAASLPDPARDARTALVILSDGGDTVSLNDLDAVAQSAADAFDVVHAVALQTSEQDTATLEAMVSGGGTVAEAVDTVALASVYTDLAGRITNQYVLRWTTSLEADTSVQVSFESAFGTVSVERFVDVDEALIARLAAEAQANAATTVPPTTTTIVINTELMVAAPPETLPGWVLIVGLTLVALGLLAAGVVATLPSERHRSLSSELRPRLPQGHELSGLARRVVYAFENWLRRDPDRQVGLALRIERAGLDISPAEFVATVAAGAAVFALLGFGLFGLVGLVLMPTIGSIGAFAWLDQRGRKRSAAFTAQLDSTLQLLAGSLRSGFGIMQALGTVAEEAESPTSDEFARVLGEVRLGRDLGDALRASGARVDTPDYDWAIQAIDISREVGGNLAEVLDNVSITIRQRNTLRRQVVSLSAEGRVSGVILFGLPIVMALWMQISNPDYLGVLYTRTGGQAALLFGVFLLIVGGAWMRKIVRIPF